MSSRENNTPFQGARFWRALIYITLIVFGCMYLLPLFVMLVTSFKELDEIRQGNMLALPQVWTIEPWVSAWGSACIGLTCEGINGYFMNSIMITVPGVLISTILGALNGYVLTKWRFRGHRWVFGIMLFGCFIPFQVVLVPMSQVLGTLGLANTTAGLVLVHVIYGVGFTTLFFRNYYEAFPSELIRAAMIDGAGFFRMFFRILLPSSGPIIVVTIIWQFTNIWNDFLFGASFASGGTAPITVALNNLVNSSTGVKEYNVHMAGAMIAALPTLLVYILAGRYFVRGLMAGSVKG
ncbi:sugar ABC transporter permease [Enterovibrio norvegicus FF-33]|uniref:Sugar ABC transporter permease n=1 Tax=Enterovibrio norvegicus FF-454 TaxID=1185651 RepID=A0A1E5BYY3_9GAMM|nr:carbohydrate ABC transporter permease [Enterovibrio norvegicus]OEE58484.1 sugar ABC transporter permease [Enterovibrio norvegicus FF-454]OEE66449.1 sugar ABC transporter permease [Enterovibrio norvegicus FF-33]OEE84600.1 sugar ABC transporter permease [Enterovibrio norvegicus FF-162]